MTCGIYKITLIADGRCYVGQSADIERRWIKERSELRHEKFHGKRGHHLQCAWAKYGEDAFTFEIAEVVDIEGLTDEEADIKLTAREQSWMDNTESEFNKRPAAGSMRGYRFTDEQRAYQSKRGKETWPKGSFSDEHRARISHAKQGQTHTPETCALLSELQLGTVPSPESLAKRRESMLAVWQSPEYREKMEAVFASPEHSAKISEATRLAMARPEVHAKLVDAAKHRPPVTDAFRALMSEIVKARPPASPETCARISAGKQGCDPSPITRARMSESHIGKPWSPLRRERHEARKAAKAAQAKADEVVSDDG